MNKENIEKVTSFIKSICLNSEYELIDVEHLGGSNKSNIVIFIDKEDGITLDDCVDFNQLINSYTRGLFSRTKEAIEELI